MRFELSKVDFTRVGLSLLWKSSHSYWASAILVFFVKQSRFSEQSRDPMTGIEIEVVCRVCGHKTNDLLYKTEILCRWATKPEKGSPELTDAFSQGVDFYNRRSLSKKSVFRRHYYFKKFGSSVRRGSSAAVPCCDRPPSRYAVPVGGLYN